MVKSDYAINMGHGVVIHFALLALPDGHGKMQKGEKWLISKGAFYIYDLLKTIQKEAV